MDVTPLSLGLETMGGAMAKIIARNSPIPCHATEGFTTYADNQTGIDFNILQGERELARDCRSLGRFKLKGIPPMVAGMARVAVRFHLDADGVLNVSAKEESTGALAHIDVQPMSGLTDGEVEAMLDASFKHAREDFDARRRADLKVELATNVRHTEKRLPEVRAELDRESVLDIEEALVAARKAQESEDTSAVQRARDELDRASMPLAALLMDQVAKHALRGKGLSDFK
jgi:molecular chaperone HscA